MARKKLIPDQTVFDVIMYLLENGGEKAVAFSTVGQKTGLAPATLVQRFGTRDRMVQLALTDAWDRAELALGALQVNLTKSPKGAAQLLKSLPDTGVLMAASLRDAALRKRATEWRSRVEGSLSICLGDGEKGSRSAAIAFALWQGQIRWAEMGGKSFRLKEALKRVT